MLCSICQKNDAVMSYTEISNGVKKEHHICSECASKYTGIGKDHFVIGSSNLLASLLASVLGHSYNINKDNLKKTNIVCPNCGMTYNEFLKYSKYGCAECFKTFSLILDPYLKKIQGSCEHTGKLPSNLPETVVLPVRETGNPEKSKADVKSSGSNAGTDSSKAGAAAEEDRKMAGTAAGAEGQNAESLAETDSEKSGAAGAKHLATTTETDDKKPLTEAEQLQLELNQAIKDEEYETAADLRDRIRELKKGAAKSEEVV